MIRVLCAKAAGEGTPLARQRRASEALLMRALGVDTLPEIMRREGGKPYIPSLPDFHYSISHSGEFVMLAYGDAEVGVDLERIRPIKPSVVRRFLGGISGDDEALVLAWVEREAYGKFTGEGFFADPGMSCLTCRIPAPEGYVAALCCEKAEEIDGDFDLFDRDFM